eukprot:sb/3468546/
MCSIMADFWVSGSDPSSNTSEASEAESLPDYLPPPQYEEVFREDERRVTMREKGGLSLMEVEIMRSVFMEGLEEFFGRRPAIQQVEEEQPGPSRRRPREERADSEASEAESLPDYLPPPQYEEVFREDERRVTMREKGGLSLMEVEIMRSVFMEGLEEFFGRRPAIQQVEEEQPGPSRRRPREERADRYEAPERREEENNEEEDQDERNNEAEFLHLRVAQFFQGWDTSGIYLRELCRRSRDRGKDSSIRGTNGQR